VRAAPDRIRARNRLRPPHRTAAGPLRADEITAGLPKRAWQRLSAGAGAKGQRFYDWALIAHPDPAGTEDNPAGTECWWLLVRRHRHTGEPAFYRCYSPEPSRYASWSASPADGGPWRSPSRPARA
jgi:hypothetical protein